MAGKQGGDSQAQLARVKGIYDSGLDELDSHLILTDLGFAQMFLEGEGAVLDTRPVTRFAIFLDDPDDTGSVLAEISAVVDDSDVRILDWQEMMPQMVQFIALDDAGKLCIPGINPDYGCHRCCQHGVDERFGAYS